jgi:hypothetical protein
MVAAFLNHLKETTINNIINEKEESGDDFKSPDEYVRLRPQTIDEAIERAIRHKIEEAKKVFQDDYKSRENCIISKLVELEQKSGIMPSPMTSSVPGSIPAATVPISSKKK